jgi:hypothetical protein
LFYFKIKDEVEQLNGRIDQHVEIVQEEIEVRIENLKACLNNFKNDLFNELEEKKEDMKAY